MGNIACSEQLNLISIAKNMLEAGQFMKCLHQIYSPAFLIISLPPSFAEYAVLPSFVEFTRNQHFSSPYNETLIPLSAVPSFPITSAEAHQTSSHHVQNTRQNCCLHHKYVQTNSAAKQLLQDDHYQLSLRNRRYNILFWHTYCQLILF